MLVTPLCMSHKIAAYTANSVPRLKLIKVEALRPHFPNSTTISGRNLAPGTLKQRHLVAMRPPEHCSEKLT